MKIRFRYALAIPALLLVPLALASQPPAEPATDTLLRHETTSTTGGASGRPPTTTGADDSLDPRQAPRGEWVMRYFGDDRVRFMRYFRDDRADPQGRLRDAVSRAFDARQTVQRAEVERLRRELAEIETAIQERERQRERIIERRVRELMQMEEEQPELRRWNLNMLPRTTEPPKPTTNESPSGGQEMNSLRELVSRAFDARQAAQRADVERMRRELAEIEAAIEQRERRREQIIDQRVQTLMHQDAKPQSTIVPPPVMPESTWQWRGPGTPPGFTLHVPGADVQYGFNLSETPRVLTREESNPAIDELTYRMAEADIDQRKVQRLIELAHGDLRDAESELQAIRKKLDAGQMSDAELASAPSGMAAAQQRMSQARQTLVTLEADHEKLRVRMNQLTEQRDRLAERLNPEPSTTDQGNEASEDSEARD